jgi:GNAT superfamily N-acetyltransferase
MRIRAFQRSDVPVVQGLLKQLGYDVADVELAGRVERVFAASDHYVAVAEQDGQVVGLLHAFVRPALEKPCEAVVQAIVVDSGSRGCGVGKALMSAAETWARSKHLNSVALSTRKAEAFYALLGYDKVATSHLMRKDL